MAEVGGDLAEGRGGTGGLAAEAIPRNPWRALLSSVLWRACAHLATDAVVASVGLALLVLLAVGVCLVPAGLIGLPAVVAAGWGLYQLAAAERTRFAATCGLLIPAPSMPPFSWSVFRSAVSMASRPATWRLIGYFVVLVPTACVTSVGVAVVWAVPMAFVLLPAYYPRLPSGRAALGPLIVDNPGTAVVVALVALVIGATLAPLGVRALLAVDLFLGRALLTPPRGDALAERIEWLTRSRARVVDAAEAERRRIERDLHDGAQQRLVAMSMMLGRASSRLRKAGDQATVELVEDARQSALQAITELRDLARGLHPPVLSDRGLDAALSAVAARSPVPVEVDVQVTSRPSITVEAIAYFVVTEALTNVAKHAQAARAWVVIRRVGDRLTVTVGDDGRGGADPTRGSGLTGLADRVAGVDGRLRVESPAGGPTVIEVELACGS